MMEREARGRAGCSEGGRAFLLWGAAFLAAAVVVAVVHAGEPVTRGWWLVAFLSLVGGVGQILLGWGLAALLRWRGARPQDPREALAQLVLWNGGTVTVAVADLVPSATGVLVGGVLLAWALALFATALRRAGETGRRLARGWTTAYTLVLAVLGASVVVGILLAHLRGR